MDYTQQILRFDEAQPIPLLTQALIKVKRSRSSLLNSLLFLALIVITPVSYAAQDYKLNDTFVLGGDVDGYGTSPDGNWAVYGADQDTDGIRELYSVPVTGGTPTKLNGSLVAGGNVRGFIISPDSSRVVYWADQDTDEVTELYSVPIAGGTPVKLNGSLAANAEVASIFAISPDNSRVVYWAQQKNDNFHELYSVPVAGGTPVKLNGPLVSNVSFKFAISPDSSRVVYSFDQDTVGVIELYSAPLAGGTPPVKLNDSLALNRDVSRFFISSDSSRVVYRADQKTDEVFELYSVPITGGTLPIKLNDPLVAGGDVSEWFFISPDSSRVVYWADQDTDEVTELYSNLIAGGTPIKLNGTLTVNGDVKPYFGFDIISPDSSRVVYWADQDTDEVDELYSVPLVGGTPLKLNGSLAVNGDVKWVEISPDSSWVVYTADQDTDAVDELYSVPLPGGIPVKLNGPLAVNGDVFTKFVISPDSSRVVYRADQDTDEIIELYSVLMTGETPIKLNGTLAVNGDVDRFFRIIRPGSGRVLYSADQDTDEVIELYATLLPIGSFPYTESFENGPAGWVPDGSLWELGTPANTVIIGAAKGVNAWITDLDANYPNGAFEAVVSPPFDFSGFTAQEPTISMDVWWQSENSWDGAILQSSIDGGTSWVDVGTNGDPNNWYNDDTINGLSANGESGHGWTGRNATGSGAYVKATHTLTGLAGQTSVQLRVLFGSEISGNDNGFAFDNLYIGRPDFDGDFDPDVTDPDDDNDGLTDVYEIQWGLDPFNSSDAGTDSDGDGLTSLEEYNINPNLNPTDPDTDGDGIDDSLDPIPLISSNKCTGGTMSGPLFVDATFIETISDDFSCGATNSIIVALTHIESSGNLLLMAPTVIFESGFNAEGGLRVNTSNSCANCGP